MNSRTELPTTKETTTDPTTIILGTPFLVARKIYSDAVVVQTQYENSVKKSRQNKVMNTAGMQRGQGIILNSRNKLLTAALRAPW